MKKSLILILLLSISLFGASFDCAKATTKVEKMICADPELSVLDEKLHIVYKKALGKSSDKAKLIQEQRDWVKERNSIFLDSNLGAYAEFIDNRIIALQETPPSSPEKEKLIELFQHFQWDRYGGRAEMLLPREKPMLENWQQGKFELILPTFQTEKRDDPRLKKLEQQCPAIVKKALDFQGTYSSNAIKHYRIYDINKTSIILEQLTVQETMLIATTSIYADIQTCKQLFTSGASSENFGSKIIERGVLHYGSHLLSYILRLDDGRYGPGSTLSRSPLYYGKKVGRIEAITLNPKSVDEGFDTVFSPIR